MSRVRGRFLTNLGPRVLVRDGGLAGAAAADVEGGTIVAGDGVGLAGAGPGPRVGSRQD